MLSARLSVLHLSYMGLVVGMAARILFAFPREHLSRDRPARI